MDQETRAALIRRVKKMTPAELKDKYGSAAIPLTESTEKVFDMLVDKPLSQGKVKPGMVGDLQRAKGQLFDLISGVTRSHPKLTAAVAIVGGVITADAIFGGKVDAREANNISGRKHPYWEYAQKQGIRPTYGGRVSDFGSGLVPWPIRLSWKPAPLQKAMGGVETLHHVSRSRPAGILKQMQEVHLASKVEYYDVNKTLSKSLEINPALRQAKASTKNPLNAMVRELAEPGYSTPPLTAMAPLETRNTPLTEVLKTSLRNDEHRPFIDMHGPDLIPFHAMDTPGAKIVAQQRSHSLAMSGLAGDSGPNIRNYESILMAQNTRRNFEGGNINLLRTQYVSSKLPPHVPYAAPASMPLPRTDMVTHKMMTGAASVDTMPGALELGYAKKLVNPRQLRPAVDFAPTSRRAMDPLPATYRNAIKLSNSRMDTHSGATRAFQTSSRNPTLVADRFYPAIGVQPDLHGMTVNFGIMAGIPYKISGSRMNQEFWKQFASVEISTERHSRRLYKIQAHLESVKEKLAKIGERVQALNPLKSAIETKIARLDNELRGVKPAVSLVPDIPRKKLVEAADSESVRKRVTSNLSEALQPKTAKAALNAKLKLGGTGWSLNTYLNDARLDRTNIMSRRYILSRAKLHASTPTLRPVRGFVPDDDAWRTINDKLGDYSTNQAVKGARAKLGGYGRNNILSRIRGNKSAAELFQFYDDMLNGGEKVPRWLKHRMSAKNLTNKEIRALLEDERTIYRFASSVGTSTRTIRAAQIQLQNTGPILDGLFAGNELRMNEHFLPEHYRELRGNLMKEGGWSRAQADLLLQDTAKSVLGRGGAMKVMTPVEISATKSTKFTKRTRDWIRSAGRKLTRMPSMLSPIKLFGTTGQVISESVKYMRHVPGVLRNLARNPSSLFSRIWSIGGFLTSVGSDPHTILSKADAKTANLDKSIPETVISDNKYGRGAQAFKIRMGNKLIDMGNRISGGAKSRGQRGFATKLTGKTAASVGKILQRFKGTTALNAAFLFSSLGNAKSYDNYAGGVVTETVAWGAEFSVYSLSVSAATNAVKLVAAKSATKAAAGGATRAAIKATAGKLPGWTGIAVAVVASILVDPIANAFGSLIRGAGLNIFGESSAAAGAPPGLMIPKVDYWNSSVSSSYASGNTFGGIRASGPNMTPFGSPYDAERDPNLVHTNVRQYRAPRPVTMPSNEGLVFSAHYNRNGAQCADQMMRSMPATSRQLYRQRPQQAAHRGTAA